MKIYLDMLSKKIIFPLLALAIFFSFGIHPTFAQEFDKIIVIDGRELEIAEITKQYKMSKHSSIIKSQGYTATGEMFFLRVSPTFEKVMILDMNGQWLKAELKEIQTDEIIPKSNIVEDKEKIELHILTDQYDRIYNKQYYKFFVKTFDKSVYSGSDF